jgi:general stress protein YciG
MAVTEQRDQESQNGFNSMDNQQSQGNGRMEEDSTSNNRRNGSSNRGFAAMSPEKQKEIASEGGRAAHQQGVAHEWNSEEARLAGRKGGQTVSQNREHMSEIGRRGGQSSGGRRNRNKQNEGNS